MKNGLRTRGFLEVALIHQILSLRVQMLMPPAQSEFMQFWSYVRDFDMIAREIADLIGFLSVWLS